MSALDDNNRSNNGDNQFHGYRNSAAQQQAAERQAAEQRDAEKQAAEQRAAEQRAIPQQEQSAAAEQVPQGQVPQQTSQQITGQPLNRPNANRQYSRQQPPLLSPEITDPLARKALSCSNMLYYNCDSCGKENIQSMFGFTAAKDQTFIQNINKSRDYTCIDDAVLCKYCAKPQKWSIIPSKLSERAYFIPWLIAFIITLILFITFPLVLRVSADNISNKAPLIIFTIVSGLLCCACIALPISIVAKRKKYIKELENPDQPKPTYINQSIKASFIDYLIHRPNSSSETEAAEGSKAENSEVTGTVDDAAMTGGNVDAIPDDQRIGNMRRSSSEDINGQFAGKKKNWFLSGIKRKLSLLPLIIFIASLIGGIAVILIGVLITAKGDPNMSGTLRIAIIKITLPIKVWGVIIAIAGVILSGVIIRKFSEKKKWNSSYNEFARRVKKAGDPDRIGSIVLSLNKNMNCSKGDLRFNSDYLYYFNYKTAAFFSADDIRQILPVTNHKKRGEKECFIEVKGENASGRVLIPAKFDTIQALYKDLTDAYVKRE